MIVGTNVLHIPVACIADVDELRVELAQFGDVAAVEVGSGAVEVVATFYDVRSAQAAAEALSEKYGECTFGLQAGDRTVELVGAEAITMEDFHKISHIAFKDPVLGKYVVEFYDTRDAEAIKSRTDPFSKAAAAVSERGSSSGHSTPVAPPPGLEGMVPPPPPGLGSFSFEEDEEVVPSEPKAIAVHIMGLPHRLLSKAMFEAVLDQAGIQAWQVIGDGVTIVKETGEVVVLFGTYFEDIAHGFAAHVRKVRWGDGSTVAAVVDKVYGEPQQRKPRKPSAAPAVTAAAKPARKARTTLSKDAPAYINVSSQLSAAAPEFVPGGAAPEAAFGAMPWDSCPTRVEGSEASTDLGDSEGDDKDMPVMLAVPQM